MEKGASKERECMGTVCLCACVDCVYVGFPTEYLPNGIYLLVREAAPLIGLAQI